MHKVPDKRCDNGHFIDESWDLCPYCPADRKESIPVVRPRNPSPSPAEDAGAADKNARQDRQRPGNWEGFRIRNGVQ